jgi:hypothetical protein
VQRNTYSREQMNIWLFKLFGFFEVGHPFLNLLVNLMMFAAPLVWWLYERRSKGYAETLEKGGDGVVGLLDDLEYPGKRQSTYLAMLTKGLQHAEKHLGKIEPFDADKSPLRARLFKGNSWPAKSYAFSLKLAVIYPLVSLFTAWVLVGQNTSGIPDLLLEGIDGLKRALAASGLILTTGMWYMYTYTSGPKKYVYLAVALVFAGALVSVFAFVGASPAGAADAVAHVVAVALVVVVAFAGAFVAAIAGAVAGALAIAGAGAFAFAGAFAGALALAFAVAGTLALALAFAVAVTLALAVAFAGAGTLALANAGAGALVVAVAVAVAGAVAFAFAVAIAFASAGTLAIAVAFAVAVAVAGAVAGAVAHLEMHSWEKNWQGRFYIGHWLFFIALVWMAAWFSQTVPVSLVSLIFTFLVFMVLLPLINALYDWLSIGLTRRLLTMTLEHQGHGAFYRSGIDVAFAVLFLTLLSLSMTIALQVLNMLAISGSGIEVYDLTGLLGNLRNRPSNPAVWWVYFTLFSTLLPTFAHGFIAVSSQLGRTMSKDKRTDYIAAIRDGCVMGAGKLCTIDGKEIVGRENTPLRRKIARSFAVRDVLALYLTAFGGLVLLLALLYGLPGLARGLLFMCEWVAELLGANITPGAVSLLFNPAINPLYI